MKLDTEDMPFLAYDQLRVEKPIEDNVRVKCYDENMTRDFSQFEENQCTCLILFFLLPLDWPGCRST